jgi:hypothetical protein
MHHLVKHAHCAADAHKTQPMDGCSAAWHSNASLFAAANVCINAVSILQVQY